jgi:hypothetical protein
MDESYRFARTPDGWRFTAPMVWPTGGRVYLVNDARRGELLRRLELSSLWINRLCLLWWVPMFVAHETRIDLFEGLSHAIGISGLAMALAIVSLPSVLILGTPALQLLAIRSILVRAVATSTQVGLWEHLWATSKSLSRSSYLTLTILLLLYVVGCGFLCYVALLSYEAATDWFFFVPLALGISLILSAAIPAMAALLFKLGVGHCEDER